MFNEHFNERAQVHQYNCSNLLLSPSCFFLQIRVANVLCKHIQITFATLIPCLGGISVAKVICIRMTQNQTRTKPMKGYEEGILHHVKLNYLVQLNSPQIIA